MKKVIFWAVAIPAFIPLLFLVAFQNRLANKCIDWLDALSDWAGY